jgi:threonine synthase
LLDVAYDWDRVPLPGSWDLFLRRCADRSDPLNRSGVWRFRELLPFAPAQAVQTLGEGQTLLQQADGVARYVGLRPGRLFLQYEGLNPSGSFKDNGMTAAFTHAVMVGAQRAACASTGNTSASLALFAAVTGRLRAVLFVGSGKIALGKLAQALDHGAMTLQIEGDFDDALEQVRRAAARLRLYLVNSLNPFRLEGQKTTIYRILEGLNWEPPDWIVVPAGNLGNVSAFGKALGELQTLGLLQRLPRLVAANAAGADTLHQLWNHYRLRWQDGQWDRRQVEQYFDELRRQRRKAATVASAIEILRPVNLPKALRALEATQGVVAAATDAEILEAKAQVGAGGLGCEPASAASVAVARKLRHSGQIAADDRVVCVLTGHALKDPDVTVAYHSDDPGASSKLPSGYGLDPARPANRPIRTANDLEEIVRIIESRA